MLNNSKSQIASQKPVDKLSNIALKDSDSTDSIIQKKFFTLYPAMKAIALFALAFVVIIGAQTLKSMGELNGVKSNAAYEDFNKELLGYIRSAGAVADQKKLTELATKRRNQFMVLMEKSPQDALSLALKDSDRKLLPKQIQYLVEERKTEQGIFSPVEIDNLAGRTDITYDAIVNSSGYTRLFFVHKAQFKSGDYIRVDGIKLDEIMVVQSASLTDKP